MVKKVKKKLFFEKIEKKNFFEKNRKKKFFFEKIEKFLPLKPPDFPIKIDFFSKKNFKTAFEPLKSSEKIV